MRLLAGAFFLFLNFSCLVNGVFFGSPDVSWSYQLPGSGTLDGRGLRRGNAVVSTAGDDFVLATADDGSLHIINTNNLDASVVVDAPTIDGAYTECRSGVSLAESGSTLNFAVYAVIFTPTSSAMDTSSRVVAVDVDGTTLWSVDIDGHVEGTPLIGQTLSFIYVVHNVFDSTGNYEGRVSVIARNNRVSADVVATMSGGSEPFGPPTIRSTSQNGMERDVLFWGESSDSSSAGNRSIYTLLPSSQYDSNFGVGADSYTVQEFGVWEQSLFTPPTVSDDLSGLWVGGTTSVVSGWVANQSPLLNLDGTLTVESEWQTLLEQPAMDPSQALITSIAVSSDSSLIYVTDAGFNLVCLSADTGEFVWFSDGNGTSGYMADPKLSEISGETPVVYVIEALSGNIRQHDGFRGAINWELGCSDRGSVVGCQESVEANFHISLSGNVLFFGDIFGKVTAINVADFPVPTFAPVMNTIAPISAAPVTESPSASTNSVAVSPVADPSVGSETDSPTANATEGIGFPPTFTPTSRSIPTRSPILDADNFFSAATDNPEDPGGNTDNLLLIILVALAGGCTMVAIAFLLLTMRKRRRAKASEEAMKQKKKREAEQRWEERQKELEEECRLQELEAVNSGNKPVASPSPKKSSSVKTAMTINMTPTSLESIEEANNEDMSVVSELPDGEDTAQTAESYDLIVSTSDSTWSTGMQLLGSGSGSDNSSRAGGAGPQKGGSDDSNGFAYLPKALSSTFDQMSQSLGFSDARKKISLGNAPPAEAKPQLSEKEAAFQRYYIPGADYQSQLPAFEEYDESSIGSTSLYVDDESIGSSHIAESFSYDSEPGQIKQRSAFQDPLPEKEQNIMRWDNLMASILQVDKAFFEPTLGLSTSGSSKQQKVTQPPVVLSQGNSLRIIDPEDYRPRLPQTDQIELKATLPLSPLASPISSPLPSPPPTPTPIPPSPPPPTPAPIPPSPLPSPPPRQKKEELPFDETGELPFDERLAPPKPPSPMPHPGSSSTDSSIIDNMHL